MLSPRPVIVFAPGAGAPSTSGWMQAWTARLATLGTVACFDYPYMRAGRRAPDRLPTLQAAHRDAVRDAQARHPGPLVLAGKSMGSRIGCHVAAAEPGLVAALVCLGYPLRGQRGDLRDQVLLALRTPILFVQGTRDPLCPLDDLATVRARMVAPSELLVVEGGDHSLQLRRKDEAAAGVAQPTWDDRVLSTIAAFLVRSIAP